MNEDILSFIWRFQYFNGRQLRTEQQMQLSILKTGYKNANAGPDFLEAAVVIDGVKWHGGVEIHVRSSDWHVHGHSENGAYENVVLHVVWENDQQIIRKDGSLLPTLSLKNKVKAAILQRYRLLQDIKEGIPCAALFGNVEEIQKFAMLDRVLLERLDKKAKAVAALLEKNGQDWEKTAYQWLGMHFGFKLNDPVFLRLLQIVPLRAIQKQRDRLIQIEALLFGCAGLIPEQSAEIYVRQLKQEYVFMASKYQLSDLSMQKHEWKFSKLRPAGFPTIRLAQLAMLLSTEPQLFSRIISDPTPDRLIGILQQTQSEYWTSHYIFGKKSAIKVPAMGKDAAGLLIINGAVPILFAFARHKNQPELLDRAIYWLSQITSENNRITREWVTLGMKVKTAADSQGLIEWYNSYCTSKRCLECAIGAALVRGS